MIKIIERPPIKISSIEEIKNLESPVLKRQIFEFNCIKCGILVQRPLERIIRQNYTLFCFKCAKGLKSKQTKLKKYGNPNYNNPEKNKQTKLERYGSSGYNNRDLARKNNLQKYGVENPSQLEEIKKKKKETCLKHYGVTNPTYIEDHIEKTNQTSLEKYGTLFPSQAEEVKEKVANTNLEKYGFKCSAQNEDVKEKSKQTTLKHYGVEYSLQSEEVREKGKQTNLKKYGFENAIQSKEVQERAAKTNFKRYGFKSSAQNPIVKEKVLKSLKKTLSKRTDEDWRKIRRKACKAYTYQNQHFDSSWELALYIYAKDHNEEIEREPCCFEYQFKGKTHRYFPDFKYKGQLIEIKGRQFFKNHNPLNEMIDPYDSTNTQFEAKHQCGLSHNVQFWSLPEITPYLNYIKETYGKDYLQQFRNK